MNKEIALKWAEALESGKYKQGKCALKIEHTDNTYSYCCLGVLAEIVDPESDELELCYQDMFAPTVFERNNNVRICSIGSIGGTILLKTELKSSTTNDLASWNDSGEKNFNQIAQYIRENYQEM